MSSQKPQLNTTQPPQPMKMAEHDYQRYAQQNPQKATKMEAAVKRGLEQYGQTIKQLASE